MREYSFILPLSSKENTIYLKASIDSMISQSLSPKEIIIIIDNVSNLDHLNLINNYKNDRIKIIHE